VSDRAPAAAAFAGSTSGRTHDVASERLVQDWKQAQDRARRYAAALGFDSADCDALAARAIAHAVSRAEWAPESDAITETLRALRELVLASSAPADADTRAVPNRVSAALRDRFVAWRLRPLADAPARRAGCTPDQARAWPTPPITRRSMAPEWLERRFLRRLFRRRPAQSSALHAQRELRRLRARLPWTRTARRRRVLLAVLVLIPSAIASGFMLSVLPHQGRTGLELAIVAFFGALFGWISIGFWTATLGFFTLIGRRQRFAISHAAPPDAGPFAPGGRTAIVIPIAEEPVDRVFAGLRAIYASLERTGALAHFDFFILSDSSTPETFIREEDAWQRWCRDVDGLGKIFYRRRQVRVRRKSGNVADFCRRWGAQYRYMIMLDADSIMAGETLVRLVQMMEQRPDVGMIQTAPTAVNRRSLFARVQQFASRVYGPMFAAGLHYWQLGDGQYWGHNTIIRIAPFMAHCALPKLPGQPPLGGEILSHDFVEAALMGRAGWTLWLAYDLGGSYEEVPSTLLEEMKRDRRWCQGNLQHLRLLFTEGLFGAHRALFVNGVLSYVSALLWFTFLALSTAEAILDKLHEPDYFPHGPSLFPEWPIWRPDWALSLLAVTGLILFLPKLLSIVLIAVKSRQSRAYGGIVKLGLSVLVEIIFSSLLAPIRMVFHSRFVVQNVLGRTVTWRSQGRGDDETSWGEAIRHHGFDTLFASAWGTTLYWLNPGYFWWVTPIIGALFLSIPLSVLASRVRLGERARAWGLFLIPEETAPPAELQELDAQLAVAARTAAALPALERDAFIRVAVDPYINALHRAFIGGTRTVRPTIAAERLDLLARALETGPGALTPRQRRMLLRDPALVERLHGAVWAVPDRDRAARWGRPGAVR
jgi:membrane glycosyltransferase